jgi:hypothetical protein
MTGPDFEFLRIVFDERLSTVVVGDLERLDQGVVDRVEEPLPLGGRSSFEDLDPLRGIAPDLSTSGPTDHISPTGRPAW